MVGLLISCTACDHKEVSILKTKNLLIYCGITMVKPMTHIAANFEKEHPHVKVTIVQGGSQDLYNSLKMSRQGDLYLPGSASYRTDNLKDGLLGETVFLGYNQAALMVKKGNPKNFSGDIG
ncbi:MAG: substrate-binding domain-containing protein, partial [Candidatus Omnitrophica bacterium]|nr:substrate-binding domain-containing protein [Candidatus Omnitrophota bacterium]